MALGAGTVLLILDIVGLIIVWPLVIHLVLRHALSWPQVLACLIVYPATDILAFYALGLYRRENSSSLRTALRRVPFAATMGALLGSFVLFFVAPDATRLGLAAGVSAVVAAALARLGFDTLRRRGLVTRRLLVLGVGKRAFDLVWLLRHEGRSLGYAITFLQDPVFGAIDERMEDPSIGTIVHVGPGGIREVASRIQPDEIVVAPDERRGMDLHGLLDCKIAGFPVSEYLSFLEREVRRVDMKRIELSWLLYSEGFHLSILDRVLKRLLDLVVSLLGIVVVGPFLLLAMLAIKIEDGGPALYRQVRVTQHGRNFNILKLRTMRVDAERGGAVWAASADKRITRLGNLMRRTRLDELPQLVNVLKGEMSFVGPRPERPEFVAMLASSLPLYEERHAAKAGLTGWAQINYPYGASVNDARSKLSYDLYYVKNFSILFDMLIILQTIRVVLWPGSSVR